jgi:sugar lactone lactonase YvrE
MKLTPLTRRRARPWQALGLAALGGIHGACAKDDTGGTPTPTPSPSPDMRVGAGEANAVRAVATGLTAPLDSTPSPDGSVVYYSAVGAMGGAVYSVSPTGGASTEVASGFLAPVQVVASKDGTRLYVADLGVDGDDTSSGVIWELAVSGGAKSALASTRGYAARGLDVATIDGVEWLYFVGNAPTSGQAGVFRVRSGAAVETVLAGGLFEPSGVAVTAAGTVYVADASADGGRRGTVLEVKGGQATALVENLSLGYPAGIALSYDEKFLLASSLEPGTARARVTRVDLTTRQSSIFDEGIRENRAAGGLHRAHGADLFSWIDASDPGQVYVVATKARPLP